MRLRFLISDVPPRSHINSNDTFFFRAQNKKAYATSHVDIILIWLDMMITGYFLLFIEFHILILNSAIGSMANIYLLPLRLKASHYISTFKWLARPQANLLSLSLNSIWREYSYAISHKVYRICRRYLRLWFRYISFEEHITRYWADGLVTSRDIFYIEFISHEEMEDMLLLSHAWEKATLCHRSSQPLTFPSSRCHTGIISQPPANDAAPRRWYWFLFDDIDIYEFTLMPYWCCTAGFQPTPLTSRHSDITVPLGLGLLASLKLVINSFLSRWYFRNDIYRDYIRHFFSVTTAVSKISGDRAYIWPKDKADATRVGAAGLIKGALAAAIKPLPL